MPVTIHVNGTSNSLVHKGSMGVAKSTLPDVCKTPSPGGPVPIPYPVIVSMSANLVKGTMTVKVDGGNMAAVKGSEISTCNGDEAGTVGGVKSSTFMKEATWLLYSFDVKLEGKNACRLSDKMQMNHGNTACLGGIIQTPVPGQNIIILDCNPAWDNCQKAQMRAKADSMDAIAKKRGGIQTRSPKANEALRRVGRKFQALFQEHWAATQPTGKFPSALEPCNLSRTHFDDCAKMNGKPLQADHVLELQFKGGNPAGPLRMLDSAVNQSSGSQIRALRDRGEMKVVGVQHRGC
jgi:hypothetical protein